MHKVINTLWLQGVESAPPMVQFCMEQWRLLNPGWDVVVHDEASVRELLADFPLAVDELSPQALSDVVRARLLHEAGGVWVDATVLPIVPLDAWLQTVVLDASGFFAFAAPGGDRPLASWFLAANPGNRLMSLWWQAIRAYWYKPRTLLTVPGQRFIIPPDPVGAVTGATAAGDTYPYFWFHYLFRMLIETNDEARALWETVPKFSAQPPHYLQVLCQRTPAPTDEMIRAALTGTAVQKLDWRQDYPLEQLSRHIVVTT